MKTNTKLHPPQWLRARKRSENSQHDFHCEKTVSVMSPKEGPTLRDCEWDHFTLGDSFLWINITHHTYIWISSSRLAGYPNGIFWMQILNKTSGVGLHHLCLWKPAQAQLCWENCLSTAVGDVSYRKNWLSFRAAVLAGSTGHSLHMPILMALCNCTVCIGSRWRSHPSWGYVRAMHSISYANFHA